MFECDFINGTKTPLVTSCSEPYLVVNATCDCVWTWVIRLPKWISLSTSIEVVERTKCVQRAGVDTFCYSLGTILALLKMLYLK